VYLTLPREVLASPAAAASPAGRLPATEQAPAEPSARHVEQLAEWVAAAEWPLILTANLGRDRAAVAALDALARRFAIPVAEPHPSCVNLPASHPFATGMGGTELLARADLVIVADCEVPWYPRYAAPRADAKIVHVGADPLYARYPLRAFPTHLAITGRTSTTLTQLAAALEARGGVDAAAARARSAAVAELNAARAARRAALLDRAKSETPIRYAWVGECLRKALPQGAVVVTELGVSSEQLALEEPGSLLGVSIGGGLGFGLGASLGAKLAAPHRTVVSTVGDGSYMFGNPTPFHLVARAAELPVLTIVCNNRRWQAVESATRVVYPDGRAAAAAKMPLVELEPSPEFTKVAEASAAWTRRVDDPAELPGALEAALEAVAGGNQALLDVRMEHGVR
jgi:acetolactate synthase-1/2/3 large subunit